jgi:proteasome lid subunit RPN8/RPN11
MVETHTENTALETWGAPQCPFAIEYSRRVLDDIRLAVVDAFFSLPRGGAEIGGVLLGRFDAGRVTVLDYRPLDCEHALGPSFALSLNDQARLEELLERCNEPNLRPVGWYHSHTRSEIFLSDADVEIHKRYFPEPWQIALVLRPSTMDPTRAGFFFREPDGSISCKASYQEFALQALPAIPVPLQALGFPAETVSAPSIVAEAPAPTAASFVASGIETPRPAEVPAAQAVSSDPQPFTEECPAATEALPRLAAAVAAAGSVESIQPLPPLPPTAGPPPPERMVTAGEKPAEPAQPEAALYREAVPSFAQAEPSPVRRRLAVAAMIAAALAAAAFAYQHWARWMLHVQAAAARPRPAAPSARPALRPANLALNASDNQGQLQFRWDPRSPAVVHARAATLRIQDGGQTVDLPLDATHLYAGSFTYKRRAERVEAKLTLPQGAGVPVEATTSFQGPLPPPPAPDTAGLQQAAGELEKKIAAFAKQNDEISQQNTELRKEKDDLAKQVAQLKAELAAATERSRKIEDRAEQSRKQQQRKRLENQSFFDPLQ